VFAPLVVPAPLALPVLMGLIRWIELASVICGMFWG